MNPLKIFSLITFLIFTPPNILAEKITKKDSLSLLSLRNQLEGSGFNIDTLLSDSNFQIYENIHKCFIVSPEKKIKEYSEYRKKLNLTDKKKAIKSFIKNNLDTLIKAEEKYKIPKEIIAAILGVESDFSKNNGKYNPFNVYISLYLADYKKSFAFEQLKELLIYCDKKDKDVFDLKSSYAGAIGSAQFIPSSLNRWFIGDEPYDINDCIFSIANYLSYFKKKMGSLEKAVLKYNNSSYYQKAVFELSNHSKK